MERATLLCLLGILLLPQAGRAEVKISRRADGSLVMHNEGGAASRHPARLRAVPREQWDDLIRDHADRQGLEPKLVQAVIQVESAYDSGAVSRRGAMGLMQLMPDTARELGVDDPFDPAENIRGGALYLKRMIDLFEGRLELALAAYNAGPGAVQRYRGVPPYQETQDYVRKVLMLYRGEAPAVLPGEGTLPPPPIPGRKVVLRRDPSNRIVVTTALAGT